MKIAGLPICVTIRYCQCLAQLSNLDPVQAQVAVWSPSRHEWQFESHVCSGAAALLKQHLTPQLKLCFGRNLGILQRPQAPGTQAFTFLWAARHTGWTLNSLSPSTPMLRSCRTWKAEQT
jgi:hypothetical protein